jgi:acetyl-CoA acetyltransferase
MNPDAVFFGKPISIDDVMQSRRVVDPLKLLDIVMPCYGGAAVLVTNSARASRSPHRPVRLSGYGELLTHKSITAMPDLLDSPLRRASQRAFSMAGTTPAAVNLACVYDSFTITALVSLEQAGFCKPGEAGNFVEQHDLRWNGDFPLNTHGGMLSFGQAHVSGGLSNAIEVVRQMRGDAGERQLRCCDVAYCNGGGGIMSEEVALILEAA